MLPAIALALLAKAATSQAARNLAQQLLKMSKNSSTLRNFISTLDTLTGEIGKNKDLQNASNRAEKMNLDQANQQNTVQQTPNQMANKANNVVTKHLLLLTFAHIYLEKVGIANKEQPQYTPEQLAQGLAEWMDKPGTQQSLEAKAFKEMFDKMTNKVSSSPTDSAVENVFKQVENLAAAAAKGVVENKLGIGATSASSSNKTNPLRNPFASMYTGPQPPGTKGS